MVRETRELRTKYGLARIINVDMPPLMPPDRPMNPMCWRTLLLVACVLVFAFALHAKVAVYGNASQPHASTSSKLWLSGEKLQQQPVAPVTTVFWLAVFLVSIYRFDRQPALRYQAICESVPPAQGSQLYLHRFLRPPPQQ